MTWHTVAGFSLAMIGILLVIWSLLKQGISRFTVALIGAGFSLLLIVELLR
jgi:polyferredoxin